MRAALCITALLLTACASAPKVAVQPASESVSVRASAKFSDDLFDADKTLMNADAAFAKERFAEAARDYKTVLMAERDHMRARLGYGNAVLALGQGAAALESFLALPKDHEGRLSGLVLSEIMTGTSPDPEVRLNAALEADPKDPRLWNALGQFHDGQGRPLRAQDNYLRALASAHAKGRTISASINNLGMSYLMAGRLEAALDKFEQAVSLRPDFDLYDNNRRLVYAMRGDYGTAIKGLSGMRAADVLNDAGYIAQERGERATAKLLFSRAVEIAPRHHVMATENLKNLGP